MASTAGPKVVKVEAAMVDDCVESASHADKSRTHRLQHDPRCTLYFTDDEHRGLSMEDDLAFQKVMAEEDAVLYPFTVTRTYGNR